MALMKRLAQKQGIQISGARQQVLATSLKVIQTASSSRRWLDVGEEVHEKSESAEDRVRMSESSVRCHRVLSLVGTGEVGLETCKRCIFFPKTNT